jgi:Rrf2 family protein
VVAAGVPVEGPFDFDGELKVIMPQRGGVLYSTACKYAIQAAVYLARHPGGAPSTRIAEECGLSPSFLSSVLKSLVRKGFFASTRGVHGGFVLRRAPGAIRLADLAEAVDGKFVIRECALGYAACPLRSKCALHEDWHRVQASVQRYLMKLTVAELSYSVIPRYRNRHARLARAVAHPQRNYRTAAG